MKDILKSIVNEVFSTKNLTILWKNRLSNEDIIQLDSDLKIRYKLNDIGTRNVELMIYSEFGLYFKTIALVEDTNILLPRETFMLSNLIDFKEFKKIRLNNETNVMIGAFSMESLSCALMNPDADSFTSNNTEFEMIKTVDFDSSGDILETYVKQKSSVILNGLPLENYYKSDLEDFAISSFRFKNGHPAIYPTIDTYMMLERLISQRLLEVYTIGKI